MKKEFNNLAIKQIKSVYSIYHQQRLYQEKTSNRINSDKELFEILAKAPPWSYLYELPYKEFLADCTIALKQSDTIKYAAASPDPTQAIIDDLDNSLDIEDETETLTDKEQGLRASFAIAACMQQLSISVHAQPLSRLIERVRDGDDSALFDAVIVDRSIVSSPTIARRIQIAELTNDQSFMDKLSNAITKTKPIRPKEKYDDLRFMIYLIDDLFDSDSISNAQMHDLIVKELELYDDSPDDMSAGLERLIQRTRKKART